MNAQATAERLVGWINGHCSRPLAFRSTEKIKSLPSCPLRPHVSTPSLMEKLWEAEAARVLEGKTERLESASSITTGVGR